MSYTFTNPGLEETLTGDMNMLHETTRMAFGNHNSGGNRTQFSYPGPLMDLHSQNLPSLSPQQSRSTAHAVLHSGSILSTATHADLLGAQNKAHTDLYEAFIGLKHDVATKSATITELKAELKALWYQQPHLPSKSVQEHPAHGFGASCSSQDDMLVAPPAPSGLQQSDYEDVRFWTKADWNSYLERQKNANREPNWHDFITDENGLPMSRQRHRELWDDAKTAWNSLYFRRLDPLTWSKKHGTAANYFYHTILQKYPEFRLCDGNWKLQTWATKRYSDWTKNVRAAGGLSRAKPSIVQVGDKRPLKGSERDDKASKKARVKQEPTVKQEKPAPPTIITSSEPILIDDESDSDDMYATEPETLNPKQPPPSSSSKTTGLNIAGTQEIEGQGRGDEAQAPSHGVTTILVPTATAPTLVVTHPVASTSLTASFESHPTETAIMDAPVATTSSPVATQKPLPTPVAQQPPFLPATPQPSVLSPCTSVTSTTSPLPVHLPPVILLHDVALSIPTTTIGRPARKKQMNPLANLTVPKPAIDIPKTVAPLAVMKNPAKKGKVLAPSDKLLTTRNLYMIDYKQENPGHDLDQFNAAFKQLDPKMRQTYDTRSKELKAAKAAGPISTTSTVVA